MTKLGQRRRGNFQRNHCWDEVRERIKEGGEESFGGQCKAPKELMLQTQGL